MRTYLIIRLVAFCTIVGLIFTACDEDDDDGGVDISDQTMLEIVNSETGGPDGLDSLARYLEGHQELTATLSADGEATFFAPTNAAFVNLLQVTGSSISVTDLDPEIVEAVLLYHLVPDQSLMKSDLSGGSELSTAFTDTAAVNQVITVNANGSLQSGALNQEIEIVEADLAGSNGVVHKIEDVMLPPSLAAELTPVLGTLAGTLILANEFSYLEDLIEVADSQIPDGEEGIMDMLGQAGSFTAFPPPNAVFENLAGSEDSTAVADFINGYDPATARNILLTHISSTGAMVSSDFADSTTIQAVSGVTLTITVEADSASSPTGFLISSPGTADAPILDADVIHTNGVAHVIGDLLLPE